jgi:hypothetical protein
LDETSFFAVCRGAIDGSEAKKFACQVGLVNFAGMGDFVRLGQCRFAFSVKIFLTGNQK